MADNFNRTLAEGERVLVRTGNPEGHCRTPTYLRGKAGVIHRYYGEFKNPETLAYGKDGRPAQNLYQVRFAQHEIWPGYGGAPGDTLVADIYEHWLEAAK